MRIGGISKAIEVNGENYVRYSDFYYYQFRAKNLEALLKYCFPFEDEWDEINKKLYDGNENFEITMDSLKDVFVHDNNVPLKSRIWYEQEFEILKRENKRLTSTLKNLKKIIDKSFSTT